MQTLNNNIDNDYEGIEIHAEEANNYIPAPDGTHIARCVTFIQLGTQHQEFQGVPGKDRMKIVLGWELPEDLHVFDESKGEQPFYIQNTYSLVLGDKATFKIHMEGWTGGKIDKYFNPLVMLGKPCLLTISHKPSTKDAARINAKVTGIAKLMKNQVCPDQLSKFKVLLFQKWDQDIFNKLSEWMQKTIESSPEYKKMIAGKPIADGNMEGQWQKKANPVDPYAKIPPVAKQEVSDVDELPY